MPSLIRVVKLNGEKEQFSVKKVINSAKKAGANDFLARKIAKKIEKEVYQDIKTSDIFESIKSELKREDPYVALRFNLKEAMKKLGPAGFCFEEFVRDILSNYGMTVYVNKIISGECSSYELDFLAEKENLTYLGECKFRNDSKDRIDINIPLKSYAILDDIKGAGRFKDKKLNFLIVTNSKFTNEAVKYSDCKKIELIGWNHPKGQGLEYLIESKKLYPVTILPSFKGYLMEVFNKEKLMLAEKVFTIDIEKFSKRYNIPKRQLEDLKKEAEVLLGKK
jgi:hypothetical protein